ncbi:hypothetical protein [Streptomyces sp. S4.7]|uniref:hypothetical protein n=1 Tax=Streptomyces sp. S4.7 TaxID=2705439 RepID=UPI0013D96405|nr:hypothetical protein [Streptomyces sp. S4.7]
MGRPHLSDSDNAGSTSCAPLEGYGGGGLLGLGGGIAILSTTVADNGATGPGTATATATGAQAL